MIRLWSFYRALGGRLVARSSERFGRPHTQFKVAFAWAG